MKLVCKNYVILEHCICQKCHKDNPHKKQIFEDTCFTKNIHKYKTISKKKSIENIIEYGLLLVGGTRFFIFHIEGHSNNFS